MLIKLSESENVITPLPRFGMRAFLTVPVQAGASAILRARSARPSADLPSAAATWQACAHARTGGAGLHLIGQATNYMTRSLAFREGALGPHPAREPEPV
ncbi:MAG TPA: hypothetical protein VK586_04280 [Streptosporangiaceae bacterium]|nr:hypothetical protein [Streptosporangiaceae bacterium]